MAFLNTTRQSRTGLLSMIAMGLLLAVVFQTAAQAVAATLATPRIYMNRQISNRTTGQEFEIFFDPATNVSGGVGANEVRVIFPDGDDTEWCRTAGTLTVTGVANPAGATETATSLPGTLAGTCAQGSGSGSAEANADRLLITGVDNLTAAAGKYGVKVVANAAVLGTATPSANNIKVTIKTRDNSTEIDTATVALSLIDNDQVVVSATVDPTLSVALNANTAGLGTLSTSNVNYVGVTSTVSTNATGGFVSLVKYDVTLTSGGNTIGNADGDVDPGTSEWGASTDDATSVDLSTSNASPSCSGSQQSQVGAANATALTTTFQAFASEAAAATNDATVLCFLASTSATQAPGTYQSTATLVTTARF